MVYITPFYNTPCVIIKLRLKHLLNVGKKLSCDLPENNSVDRFDSRKQTTAVCL